MREAIGIIMGLIDMNSTISQISNLHPEQVIARARELIEERGWAQKKGKNAAGCMCIAYAVSEAAGYTYSDRIASANLYENSMTIIANKIGLRAWYDVITWNDAPGRTREDILEALTL
jgi:hypothetical protein